jgi:antitoxin component YwqK of YwqJK toxin-antitoxin module
MKKLYPLLSVLFLIFGCSILEQEYHIDQVEFIGDIVTKKFTEGEIVSGNIYQIHDELKIPVGKVVNGKIQGTWTEWYPNGNKKFEWNYLDGKRNGTWIYSFENGKIGLDENYREGKKEGVWKKYYQSGQIKEQYTFSNNIKDGIVELWREDGSKRGTDNYSKGKKNGLSIRWYGDGDKMNEYVYDDGKKISSKCWDYRGHEVLCE